MKWSSRKERWWCIPCPSQMPESVMGKMVTSASKEGRQQLAECWNEDVHDQVVHGFHHVLLAYRQPRERPELDVIGDEESRSAVRGLLGWIRRGGCLHIQPDQVLRSLCQELGIVLGPEILL